MIKALTLAIGALSVLLTGFAHADDADDPFARDLLIVTDWFEGEFDNEEQIWFHRRSRADGEPPTRIHTMHRRLDLPEFGPHVFYVEEYKNNDPNDIIRQRLVTFSSDPDSRAMRVKQGFLKNAKAAIGAYQDPDKLAKLKPDEVFFIDGCDVFLRRKASQFEGEIAPKACQFGNGDKRRYSVHRMVIAKDKFWRTDASFYVADDSFAVGTPLDKPTQLRRAKTFICDYFFYGPQRSQQKVEGLRVHSQGGKGLATRKSDGKVFEIMLREKEYDFYDTRPDFIYYSLREKGAPRSTVYGIADPGSRTFGVNQGQIGAFCHLEGYTFRQSLDALISHP